MIRVSIPGKIHLIGEHSVLYGKSAILAPVNLYLSAKITKSKTKQILGIIHYDDAIFKMQNLIEEKIKQRFKTEIPNYKIEIDKTKIPVGAGLGTSASLSSAFTICLLKFLKLNFKSKDIFEIALEGEKVFHGNPSGGDLAAVLNEGVILFKKNKKDFKITPLRIKSPKNINNLILINSGKPLETTSEMVSKVNSFYKEYKDRLDKIFNSQEKLAKKLLKTLTTEDTALFLEIIKQAEKNLENLGVVGKKAKAIIRDIESLKGAAKITGAGGIKNGSGMILALHKNPRVLIEFAKKNKLDYYSITI